MKKEISWKVTLLIGVVAKVLSYVIGGVVGGMIGLLGFIFIALGVVGMISGMIKRSKNKKTLMAEQGK